MPDDIEPTPLPENPQTVADVLPHLPLPYEYASQYACVFSAAFADRLLEVQEEATQFRVTPRELTDGRFMIRGAIMSEVGPSGLYRDGFALLDSTQFDQIDLMAWDDAVALLPVEEEPVA